MVPSARKAALRMGLTECSGGRFARACSLFRLLDWIYSRLVSPGDAELIDRQSHGPGNPGQPCRASAGVLEQSSRGAGARACVEELDQPVDDAQRGNRDAGAAGELDHRAHEGVDLERAPRFE